MAETNHTREERLVFINILAKRIRRLPLHCHMFVSTTPACKYILPTGILELLKVFLTCKPFMHWLIYNLHFLGRKVPSLLEYFSYLFHYSMILAGPVCTFREFNDFIDGSDVRPKVSGVTLFTVVFFLNPKFQALLQTASHLSILTTFSRFLSL